LHVLLFVPAGQRRVLWHNMREEPVLYINGKPYVVREADQPFCNVEYTGMTDCCSGTASTFPPFPVTEGAEPCQLATHLTLGEP